MSLHNKRVHRHPVAVLTVIPAIDSWSLSSVSPGRCINHGTDIGIVVQAAAKGDVRGCVGTQIANWRDAGFLTHVDPERLRLYRLLAGQVDEVTPEMDLDWRRALAMHLW
jgi:hypothetical protein